MKYSEIALKILVAKESGIIKTHAQFWTQFFEREKIEELFLDKETVAEVRKKYEQQFPEDNVGFICSFDEDFPVINPKVKNSDKPYLLFYKGDKTLLQNLNQNVAVIGLTDPTTEIEQREIEVVKRLIDSELVIVSGLAKGCDSIAHKLCVDTNNKTIAILPTQINKISPAVNRDLAQKIVSTGGLLLTEYYKETITRQEAIGRYIERDRLQAMFSKAVILIASYRKGEGDSGSRHAMEAAKRYEIDRYTMFNKKTDYEDMQFGLNKDFVESKQNSADILKKDSIKSIKMLINPNLSRSSDLHTTTQLKLF